MKLILAVLQVAQVRAIHNPHHSIRLLTIVSVIGSKRFLTTIIPYIEVKVGQTKISFSNWEFEHKMELKKNEGLDMKYQMLTYFDKVIFSGLFFPQIAISYLSSTLCQNATFPIPHIPMLPTPHCLCYVVNFTLTHSQFHIAKIATPHCQIVNLSN
jgi:hypothetical protein